MKNTASDTKPRLPRLFQKVQTYCFNIHQSIVTNQWYFYLGCAALFLSITVLSPLLNSGYIYDDNVNSMIRGILSYQGNTISQLFFDEIYTTFLPMGRFYPLAVYAYLIDFLVTDVFLYKLIILISVLITLLLFGYFVYLLTKSKALVVLSLLVIPISFQFRLYHDPSSGTMHFYRFYLPYYFYRLFS